MIADNGILRKPLSRLRGGCGVPSIQYRQFFAVVGDARGDQGPVADEAEGEADLKIRAKVVGASAATSPIKTPAAITNSLPFGVLRIRFATRLSAAIFVSDQSHASDVMKIGTCKLEVKAHQTNLNEMFAAAV
jgi:hypothetical protein